MSGEFNNEFKIEITSYFYKMQKILKQIDELQKKINSLRPISEEQQKELRRYYNIGLTYSSNAIEGNTLTESETKIVVEDGLTVGGKPLSHHLEAIGHSKAYQFMYSLIDKKGIDENDLLNMHRIIFQGIDEYNAGNYRKIRVFISGSQYKLPEPEKVPELMKIFCKNYKSFNTSKHAVELAAEIHKDFVLIHPFTDGNGRIARLLMNLVLISAGYPVTIIPPITRVEYMANIEKSYKDDSDFKTFIAERVLQAQYEFLRMME